MNINQNSAEFLLSFGIRPSMQRIAIMDYMMANRTHPGVEEIFAALSPSMPTLSRMTVYNTLNLLSDAGAILSLEIDRTARHFDADTSPHGHFICSRCGHIDDLPLPPSLEAGEQMPGGHLVQSVQLAYRGVCKNCLKDQ
ncbi:transcriptional repressor [Bacteroidia bacterium]|nr:transcriptional repressor [Bacteroidia bacterium]